MPLWLCRKLSRQKKKRLKHSPLNFRKLSEFRYRRFYLSGLALSGSHSFASSPKVGALGSPRKLHLFAKASPFEERLPPRRGKMSRNDKRGSVDLRSKDGEGEDADLVQQLP